MKILITGSTGFVGKNLTRYLNGKYQLTPLCSKSCNLLDIRNIEDVLDYTRPDCIVHLAAVCGGIGANQDEPGRFMLQNLTMGLNLINVAFDMNIKMVNLGSICAYPKYCPIPFKESDMWNGYPEETNAPYGIAKKTIGELLINLNKQYGYKCVNLFPVNLFGPQDNFNPKTSHVIPAIIDKVTNAINNNADSIELWGTGSATRDFLYVDDLCSAIDLAINKDPGPEPMNLGMGIEYSIKEVAEKICKIMDFNGTIVWDSTKPDGQPRRAICIDEARKRLGYEPKVDLDTGLKNVVEWNKNMLDTYLGKMGLLNR